VTQAPGTARLITSPTDGSVDTDDAVPGGRCAQAPFQRLR